jgi:hypothetical protein
VSTVIRRSERTPGGPVVAQSTEPIQIEMMTDKPK